MPLPEEDRPQGCPPGFSICRCRGNEAPGKQGQAERSAPALTSRLVRLPVLSPVCVSVADPLPGQTGQALSLLKLF